MCGCSWQEVKLRAWLHHCLWGGGWHHLNVHWYVHLHVHLLLSFLLIHYHGCNDPTQICQVPPQQEIFNFEHHNWNMSFPAYSATWALSINSTPEHLIWSHKDTSQFQKIGGRGGTVELQKVKSTQLWRTLYKKGLYKRRLICKLTH